jgi:hypothetical protein
MSVRTKLVAGGHTDPARRAASIDPLQVLRKEQQPSLRNLRRTHETGILPVGSPRTNVPAVAERYD